jgi:hypothetical protein
MEFSPTGGDFKLSIVSVARAFNIDQSAVKQALLRDYEDAPGANDIQNFHPKSGAPWESGLPRTHMIIKLSTGQNY